MYAAIIISHFFILICCFYCYCKILNLNDLFLRSRILFTLSALIIACGLCFIHSMGHAEAPGEHRVLCKDGQHGVAEKYADGLHHIIHPQAPPLSGGRPP